MNAVRKKQGGVRSKTIIRRVLDSLDRRIFLSVPASYSGAFRSRPAVRRPSGPVERCPYNNRRQFAALFSRCAASSEPVITGPVQYGPDDALPPWGVFVGAN